MSPFSFICDTRYDLMEPSHLMSSNKTASSILKGWSQIMFWNFRKYIFEFVFYALMFKEYYHFIRYRYLLLEFILWFCIQYLVQDSCTVYSPWRCKYKCILKSIKFRCFAFKRYLILFKLKIQLNVQIETIGMYTLSFCVY